MAGEGYYESGDLGSAGRLASIAQFHEDRGRSIRVIAVEAHDAAFTQLQANTAELRGFIEVRHADWRTELPALLKELQGYFVFFFVDPMGVVEIPWSSMSQIVTRPDSEILVNFNSSIAARLAGFVLNGKTDTGQAARIEEVMNGMAWTSGASEARDRHELHEHLATTYARLIGVHGNFIVCWSLVREGVEEGLNKYHLIFASRHSKPFPVLNDILALQHHRLLKERALANPLPLLPQTETEYDREHLMTITQALANSLLRDEGLRGWQGSISDLIDRCFRSRFGDYASKWYADAVTLLVDQQHVATIGQAKRRGGKLQRDTIVKFI